jgi:hypothetical protein
MANNRPIVPRWNLVFSVAPRAYQSEFYIDNGSCTRALVALHSQSGSRIPLECQLARVCRIFPLFYRVKFNDVLALREDGDLGHCCDLTFRACSLPSPALSWMPAER